jgi:hypothetical protein
MQTPAHAQHAEAIGELIETPAQSVAKGNAAGAQPTVAPTARRARLSATTNQKGRNQALFLGPELGKFALDGVAAAAETRGDLGYR